MIPAPPIHFVSGRPTTLGELANLAARLGVSGPRSALRPRDFDVALLRRPIEGEGAARVATLVRLEDGLTRLVEGFRNVHLAVDAQEVMR